MCSSIENQNGPKCLAIKLTAIIEAQILVILFRFFPKSLLKLKPSNSFPIIIVQSYKG